MEQGFLCYEPLIQKLRNASPAPPVERHVFFLSLEETLKKHHEEQELKLYQGPGGVFNGVAEDGQFLLLFPKLSVHMHSMQFLLL